MGKTVMQLSHVYNEDILDIFGKTILHCVGQPRVLQDILASLARDR